MSQPGPSVMEKSFFSYSRPKKEFYDDPESLVKVRIRCPDTILKSAMAF
jgi:hypothetical protein